MHKTFVLDTSVLIYDPQAYKSFKDCNVVIPIVVLEELDKLKKQMGEAGRNARVAIKCLDELSNRFDLHNGVLLEDDVLVSIDARYRDMSDPRFAGLGDPSYGDTHILACAIDHHHDKTNGHVVLLSNDINLRVKVKARGVDALSHNDSRHSVSDIYAGHQISYDQDAAADLVQHEKIYSQDYNLDLSPNECVAFLDESNQVLCLGRQTSKDTIRRVKEFYPWNIKARNKEQAFAMDLIADRNIDLVTMTGKAGCGKSLIAIAAALELVLAKKEFSKLVIYRPIQAVGGEIGFLPGTMEEKLAPWFQAIYDSFEVLFTNKNQRSGSQAVGGWKRELQQHIERGKIEMEAITYIRGRSISNAIILIDETQNLSKEEIKTILTRAGEGTKVILTGDIEQIDTLNLDAINNGLTYAIEKFKDKKLAGHVTFTQGERSRLATMSADIL